MHRPIAFTIFKLINMHIYMHVLYIAEMFFYYTANNLTKPLVKKNVRTAKLNGKQNGNKHTAQLGLIIMNTVEMKYDKYMLWPT